MRLARDHNFSNPVRVLGARELMVVSGGPDRQMAQVAAAQRGRINVAQLRAVGMTHSMTRGRVDRGTLHFLHRGVYGVGHPGRVELGDETAALLAYGLGAALCHRSACWLWGFVRDNDEVVDLILPPGVTGKSRPGIRVHRSGTLSPSDMVIRQRLPVVKPALALLQLADVADEREVERAVDEALARRAVSRTKLREVLSAHGTGRWGAPLIAELAGVRPSSITRSDGEEHLRNLILAAGLPKPEMQAPLLGFEADYYWREAAYVVEYDGFDVHATRSAWRRDRVKDRVFAADGIRLDRFTWEDVTQQALATVSHITRQVTERTLRRVETGSLRPRR